MGTEVKNWINLWFVIDKQNLKYLYKIGTWKLIFIIFCLAKIKNSSRKIKLKNVILYTSLPTVNGV